MIRFAQATPRTPFAGRAFPLVRCDATQLTLLVILVVPVVFSVPLQLTDLRTIPRVSPPPNPIACIAACIAACTARIHAPLAVAFYSLGLPLPPVAKGGCGRER